MTDPASAPLFIISLRDSPLREEAERAWREVGMQPHFFDAIDGRSSSPEPIYPESIAPRLQLLLQGRRLTSAEVGVYFSHMRVWRRALAMGCPGVFVMEDDTRPMANWRANLSVLRAASPQIGLIYLYRSFVVGGGRAHRHPNGHRLVLADLGGCSCAGYFVRHWALRRMHDALARSIAEPVDHAVDGFIRTRLRAWEIRPYGVCAHLSGSTMEAARTRAKQEARTSWLGRLRANKWVSRLVHRTRVLSWYGLSSTIAPVESDVRT